MPDGIRTVSNYTPAGAAAQALADSWTGITPSATSLIVMLAYAAIGGGLAVRFFGWR